jgi:RNase H-fold protein (predicted Holliday junction resolvase)
MKNENRIIIIYINHIIKDTVNKWELQSVAVAIPKNQKEVKYKKYKKTVKIKKKRTEE